MPTIIREEVEGGEETERLPGLEAMCEEAPVSMNQSLPPWWGAAGGDCRAVKRAGSHADGVVSGTVK